jgi:hypothetical protein
MSRAILVTVNQARLATPPTVQLVFDFAHGDSVEYTIAPKFFNVDKLVVALHDWSILKRLLWQAEENPYHQGPVNEVMGRVPEGHYSSLRRRLRACVTEASGAEIVTRLRLSPRRRVGRVRTPSAQRGGRPAIGESAAKKPRSRQGSYERGCASDHQSRVQKWQRR